MRDITKGVITIDSGKRAWAGTSKASKDFARGDTVCAGLCCAIKCELLSGILVWYSVLGKIAAVSALKATSRGCQKFRDLCANRPSSPLC